MPLGTTDKTLYVIFLKRRNGMRRMLIVLIGIILCVGCATTQPLDTKPSPFTHGNVQLTIKKGITSQNDILENFGPPNIATIDSEGNEVWTYQI